MFPLGQLRGIGRHLTVQPWLSLAFRCLAYLWPRDSRCHPVSKRLGDPDNLQSKQRNKKFADKLPAGGHSRDFLWNHLISIGIRLIYQKPSKCSKFFFLINLKESELFSPTEHLWLHTHNDRLSPALWLLWSNLCPIESKVCSWFFSLSLPVSTNFDY